MHDRNLRIDERIFHLGTGASGAGQPPTNFCLADSTAAAHGILDQLITVGSVIHP